jgi:signal transduction histidine kinase
LRLVVLTRRLALTVLAPTLLVSLSLMGACLFGVLYLNSLHQDVVSDYSENRRSHLAATNLETTVRELLAMANGNSSAEERLAKEGEAYKNLQEAQALANTDKESALVDDIAQGLQHYTHEREAGRNKANLIGALENVQSSSIALRQYNTEQERASDQRNQEIVSTVKWVLLVVGLGAPLFGLLLGYFLARELHHSIYQLSVYIRDAAGRLNRKLGPVTLDQQGDLAALHGQVQGVLKEIEHVVRELQQREHEVLRAEQLVTLGQVAAGVAHELRNPLTSVKMLVQTGLEGQPAPGLAAGDLTIIEHEVRRMEVCIQTFLDFARPPHAQRRQADLLPVIRRAVTLLEGQARGHQVNIVAELPPGSIDLSIDPDQIQQILVNLLLNGVEAQPDGGTITVAVVRGPLPPTNGFAGSEPTQGILIRIQDTGQGIAPDIHKRLFEPFVTSKETGLGLGLSICKRLVEAHGGTIQGENAAQGGAVFTFGLPE